MKKLIVIVVAFLITNVNFAQSDQKVFTFDKKFYEAVDKWAVFPKKDDDTSFALGFIYFDEQGGFTLQYEADISITPNGLKSNAVLPSSSLKTRLSKNTIDVAILTPEQVQELGLLQEPRWLKGYKTNADTTLYLVRLGYQYNHVGGSKLALQPLLKAYAKEPHFEGLEFELSYAYNAIGEFENVITILEKALHNNPKNYYFYRELGYAFKNLNRVEEAEKIYRKGIALSDNDFEKSEMAVNMAQTYFQLRNKEKFEEWAKLTRQFAEEGSRYAQYIDHFESNWDKK
jgi:tetratricopeptide (TPR) repeat protein